MARDIDAADAVIKQVVSAGPQVAPTGVRPAYSAKADDEANTNSAAVTAWSIYEDLRLPKVTDENVLDLLDEIQKLVGQLPSDIDTKNSALALQDWGALQDRPRSLHDRVIIPIAAQCSGL